MSDTNKRGEFSVNLLDSAPVLGQFIGNGFRPPQWSFGPQLTSISAVLPGTNDFTLHKVVLDGSQFISPEDPGFGGAAGFDSTIHPGSSAPTPHSQQGKTVTYFFDAVMRIDHNQELRATEHPVQGGTSGAQGGTAASGGSIVDHAYLLPARVTLEIAMSEAMDSFVPGTWTSASTKSISAYQTLLWLQSLRVPITVTTRLNTYNNMVIEDIRSGDDVRTLHGLKVTVRFRQIITGAVTQTQSARPHATDSSNPGTTQPQAVPQSLQKYLNSSGQWSSDAPNVNSGK